MADETRATRVIRYSSGLASESSFGFSRAVRAGDWILIAGCTGTDESGTIVGINQMYTQARAALDNIARALGHMGGAMNDVVRTRVYVTDLSDLPSIARAHREAFSANPPASTLLQIGRLARPEALIEIDADAFVPEAPRAAVEPQSGARTRSVTPSRARSKAPAPTRAARAKAPERTRRPKRGR
jgi:enamine deaminase RidA (YjgF/YER057c/UK114 family)